jgi:hypothetical protein
VNAPGASSYELAFDISGIGILFRGLNESLRDRLRRDWSTFLVSAPAAPLLRLELSYTAGPAPELGDYLPKAMESSFDASAAEYRMPEGRARVEASGRAEIRLTRGLGNREYYTVQNLARACLAWSLPRRPAALLHAAGLVVAGNAFLLVGAEGAGKSTWVELGEGGGARAVSDDLLLVDGLRGRPEVLGAPFRSTHVADYRPGRWPLAAVLLPRFASETRWSVASRLLASARLTANLPFIETPPARDEARASIVERLFGRVDCLELAYRRDSGFLELLRGWPATRPDQSDE